MDEDVGLPVRVRTRADQGRGVALEGDVPAVGGDRRSGERTGIRLRTRARDAHALGRWGAAGHGRVVRHAAVAQEDVVDPVRIDARPEQVGGGAVEHDEAGIGGDRPPSERETEGRAVRLGAVRGDAHPLGRAALAVAHEDVAHAVGVPGDQFVVV